MKSKKRGLLTNRRKIRKLQCKAKMAVVLASTIYMAFSVTVHIIDKTSLNTESGYTYPNYETEAANKPVQLLFTEKTETFLANQTLEDVFSNKIHEETIDDRDSFRKYIIPKEFANGGGSLPVKVQKYIWETCKEYGVDYSLIIAMIEVESGYQDNVVSNCNAVGYMQIMEVWHKDRMKRLGATNLYNPYHNVKVGIDLMAELMKKHQASVALSIYNRGFHNKKGTGALDLAKKGIYQTEYSKKVIKRADEIRKELLK